jgi:hypothetical protein
MKKLKIEDCRSEFEDADGVRQQFGLHNLQSEI